MEALKKNMMDGKRLLVATAAGALLASGLYLSNPEKAHQAINSLTQQVDPQTEEAKKNLHKLDQQIIAGRSRLQELNRWILFAESGLVTLKQKKAKTEIEILENKLDDVITVRDELESKIKNQTQVRNGVVSWLKTKNVMVSELPSTGAGIQQQISSSREVLQ